ncbi:TPA: hypothetical protein DCP13_02230 [Candidatus Azambacteria bacterium]|nr:hypothetical protein [Candidatus Azambacteria bacterium]
MILGQSFLTGSSISFRPVGRNCGHPLGFFLKSLNFLAAKLFYLAKLTFSPLNVKQKAEVL